MKTAMTRIVAMEIADTPAAKPSNPSIRLMAFVTPTIQKIVSGMAIQDSIFQYWSPNGTLTKSTVRSKPNTTTQAAIIWPTSFTLADNSKRSSSAPVSTIIAPPDNNAQIRLESRRPNNISGTNNANKHNVITKAAKIPKPPMRGIMRVCTLRALGTSTAPTFIANFFTSGVKPVASSKATSPPTTYTVIIGCSNPHLWYRIELYSVHKGNTNSRLWSILTKS